MKKRNIVILFTLAVFSMVLVNGCGQGSGNNKVLASIGKEKITLSDFNESISNLPERYKEVVKGRKKEYLQELINDNLLYQEATKKGLHKNKDVQKVIEQARRKIVIARFLKDNIDDTIVVEDDEITAYYNANSANFMFPEVMRVSHILVPTEEQAKSIHEDLKRGASFGDTAKAKSVDPTAQNAGDIGYFPKGQLIPEFEAACAELEIGEFSEPVKTKLGYHIIKLTDRKEPALRPLEQVKEQIKAALYTMKRRDRFGVLMEDLSGKTDVVINEELLEVVEMEPSAQETEGSAESSK